MAEAEPMTNAVECGAPAVRATMDTATVVDRFPGPASLVDGDRRPILANPLWCQIGLPGPGDNDPLPGALAASLLAASHTGRPQRVMITVAGPQAGMSTPIDALCLPCAVDGEAATLVLAIDCTATGSLQQALTRSREFHRDLALCSTDTTFEIDSAGHLTYLGPCGFLGLADFELVGSRMRDLVADRSRHAAEFVLKTREPMGDAELWFTTPADAEVCFMISVMPVFDADGEWAGLRGVGRDVTGERAREAEISSSRRSQRRIDAVLHAMRSEARPSMMIAAGAASVIDTVDLGGCAVAHARDGRFDRVEACSRVDDRPGDGGRQPLLTLCRRCAKGPDDALLADRVGDNDAIVALTRYGGRINGAVVFMRPPAEDVVLPPAERWSEEDRRLLRAVAGQMSVAIAQLDLFESPFAGAV